VIRPRAKIVAELAERMRSAGPLTEDDVAVLLDGRRPDSKSQLIRGSEGWRSLGFRKMQPSHGSALYLNRVLELGPNAGPLGDRHCAHPGLDLESIRRW
jgi:hypothetical protein